MLTGEAAEMLKAATGLSDEQVAQLHPGSEKLFKNVPKMLQVQTVAEVVKSERCFAQVKEGDKLVFDPFLNPEKSTGVMCPKALLPVMLQINALWEMAAEWAESGKEELPEIVFRHARCLDPGLEDGGLGGVVYRIRSEKMATWSRNTILIGRCAPEWINWEARTHTNPKMEDFRLPIFGLGPEKLQWPMQ